MHKRHKDKVHVWLVHLANLKLQLLKPRARHVNLVHMQIAVLLQVVHHVLLEQVNHRMDKDTVKIVQLDMQL